RSRRRVRRRGHHGLRRRLPLGARQTPRGLGTARSEAHGRRRLPRRARRHRIARTRPAGIALMSLAKRMGAFERHLTWWVLACIVVGTGLGYLLPGTFAALGAMEVARVNLPVAVLIWLMIIPMLLKIDYGAMRQVTRHWRGMGVTVFVNWAIKPFSMALLAWVFIRHVFAPYLPAEQLDSYVAGLILLAAAPCTAMVFVWSHLCDGEPQFTLSQVALNDAI